MSSLSHKDFFTPHQRRRPRRYHFDEMRMTNNKNTMLRQSAACSVCLSKLFSLISVFLVATSIRSHYHQHQQRPNQQRVVWLVSATAAAEMGFQSSYGTRRQHSRFQPALQETSIVGSQLNTKNSKSRHILFGNSVSQEKISQAMSSREKNARPVSLPNNVRHSNRKRFDNSKKRKTQLRWVLQSIENYGKDPDDKGKKASDELLDAIGILSEAKTQKDIIEAGRHLKKIQIVKTESYPIQERVIKATAVSGLLHLSVSLLEQLLQSLLSHHDELMKDSSFCEGIITDNKEMKGVHNSDENTFDYNYFPSNMAYIAVCNSLRRAGKFRQLEEILHQLAAVARKINSKNRNQSQSPQQSQPIRKSPTTVHVIAFNSFLAALCDRVQKYNPNDQMLEAAYKWLEPGVAEGVFCVEPDIASYNTVLHASAKVGNQSIANKIWHDIQQLQNETTTSPSIFEPDIVTYNARLLAATSKNVDEKLAILEEINDNAAVSPDRYTIDYVLYPLIQSGRVGDVEDLLDDFVASHSEQLVSDAFSAFFISLLDKRELTSARALFDTYILPWQEMASLSSSSPPSKVTSKSSSETDTASSSSLRQRRLIVRPQVRHFNVLIEGYRRLADSKNSKASGKTHEQGKVSKMKQDAENMEEAIMGSEKAREPVESFGDTNDVNDDVNTIDHKAEEEAMRNEGRKLYDRMLRMGLEPDEFTFTSMMGICASAEELSELIIEREQQKRQRKRNNQGNRKNVDKWKPAELRAAVTAYGRLGDPSSACIIFDEKGGCASSNARVWNTLLGALADGCKSSRDVLNITSSSAAKHLTRHSDDKEYDDVQNTQSSSHESSISQLCNGLTSDDAIKKVMQVMCDTDPQRLLIAPPPNSQSYCIVASAFQYGDANAQVALDLFRDATNRGIPADGRFVNAIFRCFGDDIDAALAAWKIEIRTECLAHEGRTRNAPPSIYRPSAKNLIAAYNGLLYVCGRALRPDVAVRIAYAMNREGIEPNEVSLNCYKSGKRVTKKKADKGINPDNDKSQIVRLRNRLPKGFGRKSIPKLLPKIGLTDMYENLLYVECTKYDKNDKRRFGDKRVRIIV